MTAAARSRRSLIQRALVLQSRDLGRRVLSGATFQLLSVVLRTVLTIGSTAILARLLVPADFGYVAMATVATELAALFANFGWTNILIQRGRIWRRQLDTLFWASLGLGSLLAALVFAASPLVGLWFADPKVGDLLRVLCWSFVLAALTAVPWVVLNRLMRFRTEFWLSFSSTVIRTVVAIGCAAAGLGAWSLVAGALTGFAVQGVAGLIAVGYRPRLRFDATLITSTWRTSGSYFGGGLLYYVSMNIDLILIGRRFGAETLGYYQNARALTDEIRARIAIPLQSVLFPAFASVQSDPAQGRAMLMRSGRTLAALVVPIGIGISTMAPELVALLYGERWLAMVPLLSLLGVAASIRACSAIAVPVINAHDRVATGFRYGLIGTALTVGAIMVALPYGIEAATAALLCASLYAVVPFRFGLSLLGMGWRDGLAMLAPPFIASLSFALVLPLVRPHVQALAGHVAIVLLVHAALATVIYLAVLLSLSRPVRVDLLTLARRLAQRGATRGG